MVGLCRYFKLSKVVLSDAFNAAVMGLGELAALFAAFCKKGDSLPKSQFIALLWFSLNFKMKQPIETYKRLNFRLATFLYWLVKKLF